MSSKVITLEDIKKAKTNIQPHVKHTLLEYSQNCTKWVGSPIYLKFENNQTTGSFKVRGALNKMTSLTDEEKLRGVVASSAGNHAQGVAYSASQVNVKAHVVMPKYSSLVKRQATEGYGAQVHLQGDYYDQSYEYAKCLEEKNGYVFIHPYNDPSIIAGQGTIGLEILEDLKTVDSVVIPIGGGGLISGVATAIKALNPQCKIYGVVAENAAAMMGLYKGNEKYKFINQSTIADGIAVKKPDAFMYETYIKNLVDDIVCVNDEEVAEAIVFLLERAKALVEGAAATTLAGIKKASWVLGEKNVLLLTGGNIDLNVLSSIIERGLIKNGRLARLNVILPDRPGHLLQVTHIVAEHGANILQIHHDRLSSNLRLKETSVEFLLETTSTEHLNSIKKAIQKSGARIV